MEKLVFLRVSVLFSELLLFLVLLLSYLLYYYYSLLLLIFYIIYFDKILFSVTRGLYLTQLRPEGVNTLQFPLLGKS